jgi:GH15 family glucan-1,4-alpha-glucosidase
VRRAGDADSGLDSAAAWAVRPFSRPALYPEARRTLRRLAAGSGRFGLLPAEGWDGGEDPWTAPTAWTAWGLAGLSREAAARGDLATARVDRRAALRPMAALRRASTPLGLLPERVDAATGAPRSTTPLGWSHAFAILAIRELWPVRAG